ncbi:BTAD domain-containing putative transcriptional regulator [Microbacter sp. GSS18]|nr:BTAD domain-containing putative transcriptional regulator [Microbacter sp. GSS18]
MTVRVLGPLQNDGPALSPRERTILSALVLRRARSVSPGELADACWGENRPQTWAQQIQNSIAKIRSSLGREAVRTVGSGYCLGIPDDAVDAVQFERELSRARHHGLTGSHDRAVAAYRHALDLWRGDPYADVSDWSPAQTEAMRLGELRADAEEELLDARLRLGEDATVVPDAERMVREAPLREHRWASLALANYRAGRQAEAIAVVRSARGRIADELGLDLGRELRDLEVGILRQDPALDPPAPPSGAQARGGVSECPYRGLAAYDVEDSAMFFGRDADVRALLPRTGARSVVTIVGPSGSGKSSVLRAGLVPRLREHGRRVAVITPDAEGVVELREALADGTATIAVDQAEELLSLPGDELSELGELVRSWLDRDGTLILALRSDFLDRATAFPAIGTAIGQNVYALSPMDDDRLSRVIVGPAETAGLALETGLVEIMLRDAGERTAILPALSHALATTWSHREGATLTLAGYEATGGIAGAIAQSAERVYQALSEHGQEVCRALMMRLVERTPDGANVRRRVPLEALIAGATRRDVLESLVAARLVTIDRDSATIAHEAVGRTWPRLDAWLADDAGDAETLHRTEASAAAWDAAGRPDDDLMRGARLQTVVEWRERTAPMLTDTESDYLEASTAAHRDELRELEARAAHERADNRRLRVALTAAASLLVAAILASGLAILRSADAQAAAEDARIEALTTAVLSTATGRETAALLAAEVYRRWPEDPRALTALEGALAQAAGLVRTVRFPEDAVVAGAMIPGRRSVLVVVDTPESRTAGPSGYAVQMIDLTSGKVVRELDVDLPSLIIDPDRNIRAEAPHREVIVSGDGATALILTEVSSSADPGTCCERRLTAVPLQPGGASLATIPLDGELADRPALSADGSTAYVVYRYAASPVMIDLRTGRIVVSPDHLATGDDSDAQRLAFLDTGLQQSALIEDHLYVGARDHIRVYDASTLALVDRLDLPTRRAVSLTSLHVGPDGDGGLLSISTVKGVRLGLPDGEVIWEVKDLDCASALAVSPSMFLCAREDGVWSHSLDTGEALRRILEPLPSDSTTMEWFRGVSEIAAMTTESPAVLQRWRPSGEFSVRNADQMRDAACAVASRQLTREEWDRFFSGEPYQRTCPDVA